MLRLKKFDLLTPQSLSEATDHIREHREALIVAGGTDMVPKMKRGQFAPSVIISLAQVRELDGVNAESDQVTIGPLTTLRTLERHDAIRPFTSFHHALTLVATPIIRNAATVGGNLLQDTRCRYYDRSDFWRDSLGNCMKVGADDCKVAPGGHRCFAAFCSDLAPSLAVLDATVTTYGDDTATFPLEELYQEDGMAHLRLGGQLLTQIALPVTRLRSNYRKLRIRDGFDFPEIGVAVAVDDTDKNQLRVNIAVSGASSGVLSYKQTVAPSDVDAMVNDVYKTIKPMDTLFFSPAYRRKMAKQFLKRSLDELLSP
jgi:4-hydroxybenzoyl-CoA reductase subunit beta